MRYVLARFNQKQRDLAYSIYLTDGVKMMCENIARIGGGNSFKVRFADLIEGKEIVKEDSRSGDEIVADIVKRAGLTPIKEGVETDG